MSLKKKREKKRISMIIRIKHVVACNEGLHLAYGWYTLTIMEL